MNTLFLQSVLFATMLSAGLTFEPKKIKAPSNEKDGVATPASKLPQSYVYKKNGNQVDVSRISNNGKPFAIVLWATWCEPSYVELDKIAKQYSKWKKETGFKIFAISLDNLDKGGVDIIDFVKSKDWKFEIYCDSKKECANSFGFNGPPLTILCDGDGTVQYKKEGYADGSEQILWDQLKSITKQ